jgi:hypothetical protein
MNSSRGHTVWLIGLTLLVVIMLGLIGASLWAAWRLVAPARAALDQAMEWTNDLGNEQLTFQFPVSAEILIAMEVPFEDTFRVPIEERVPFRTEIAIDEVVEVPLSTPLGTVNLKIPVRMTVPVELEVPIELQVDVPVQTTIFVSDSVPFSMVVPVEIDLAETPLKGYLDEIGAELENLRDLLDGQWLPFLSGPR